jgi:hypothetical protein
MYRFRGRRALLALAVGAGVFGIATAVQASIPDAQGVIHGCYNTSLAHGSPTGALRVINTAKLNGNCASWETALNWNQTGPTGPTGARGPTGPKGATGPTGPGAITNTATVAQGAGFTTLFSVSGVVVEGFCDAGHVGLRFTATPASSGLEMSGTRNADTSVFPMNVDGILALTISATLNIDFDGLLRNLAVGKFAHVDVHGFQGSPCIFWWMIIPSG